MLAAHETPATAGYLIDPTGGTVLWGDSFNVDDQTVRRSLGFTASLFGTPFTEVDVSTNGNLNFSADVSYTNQAFPTGAAMIAPLWDDLYIYAGTGQRITEKAAAGQYYSVTWDVSQFSNNLPRFQFQVVLFGGTTTIGGTTFLPNDIAFAYQRVDADFRGGEATIGLNKGDGTFSTLPSLVGSGGYLGNAQTSLLPTAPGSVLLARYDGSGYGGSLTTAVVPEPSTLLLAALGMAACGWYAFNRGCPPKARYKALSATASSFLAALCMAAAVEAAPIYSQQVNFSDSGAYFADAPTYTVFDDFTLGENSAVNSLKIWGAYWDIAGYSHGQIPTPAEFRVSFHTTENSWNSPIYSNVATASSLIDTGFDHNNVAGANILEITLNLSSNIPLSSGVTYWLGIQAMNTVANDFAWQNSFARNNVYYQNNLRLSGDADLAFQLNAVPEPSTYAMALAGIACAAWGIRRHRQKRGNGSAIAALIVPAALAFCCSGAEGEVLSFKLSGSMTNSSSSGGWSAGDPFTAVYSFDTLATGVYNSNVPATAYGPSITSFDFRVAGNTFSMAPNAYGDIYVANDVYWGIDRYIATATGIQHPPLAGGLTVSFIQFDFQDSTGAALIDESLVTSHSVLQSFSSKHGRFLFSNNDQPHFAVSSVTAVPEPNAFFLAAAGIAGAAVVSVRRRPCGERLPFTSRVLAAGVFMTMLQYAAPSVALAELTLSVSPNVVLSPGTAAIGGVATGPLNGTVYGPVGYAGAPGGTTGFVTSTFVIPASSSSYSLVWEVSNEGDSSFASALAIDNVRITSGSSTVVVFGFEDGIPGGFTAAAGSVSGTSAAIDNLAPTEGSSFAFIDTTGSYDTAMGTFGSRLLSSSFSAAAGDVLAIDTAFLTTDSTIAFGDYGFVALSTDGGVTPSTVLFTAVAPVPEPSTYAMVLAGIACAAWGTFRRRGIPHLRAATTIAFAAVFVLGAAVGQAATIPTLFLRNVDTATNKSQILRFDATTGASLGNFLVGYDGAFIGGYTFGPDGNLYVSDFNGFTIDRYSGTTGAFLDTFATVTSSAPYQPLFGPDGNLYLGQSTGRITKYDGTTGQSLGVFVAPPTGVFDFGGMAFRGGSLYVSYGGFGSSGSLYRYDAATGGSRQQVYSGFSSNGPRAPVFDNGGTMYVPDWQTNKIYKFDETSLALTGTITTAAGISPRSLAFDPTGALLVLSDNGVRSQINRYDRTTGAFLDTLVAPGTGGLGRAGDMILMVPEPSACVLGAAGLVCVGWAAWRRRRGMAVIRAKTLS